jgi:cytochrome c oxidase assembly protein subunit 15
LNATAASPARNFTRFAWTTLAWNVGVVLWGAYVRVSGSGAGCGNHWPLCNGEVLPHAAQIQTLIEFTHRIMTSVAFFAVAALLLWSLKIFPRRHLARKMAIASFCFLIAEALLGAGLVLFNYVGANSSAGRALYLSLHLANTLLLLAALALTAWFTREPARQIGPVPGMLKAALSLAMLVCITGAIAALGDTLFPASSLREGFQQDWSGTAHFLVRLRVIHPVLAVSAGIFIGWIALSRLRVNRVGPTLLIATIVQLCAGAVNLALLAPAAMQIVHLFLADIVWISLVLLSAESAVSAAREAAPAGGAPQPLVIRFSAE